MTSGFLFDVNPYKEVFAGQRGLCQEGPAFIADGNHQQPIGAAVPQ